MFTRTQRTLLGITALIGAGFILGVAAQSPNVNPLLEQTVSSSADRPLPPAVAAVQERVIGHRPRLRIERQTTAPTSEGHDVGTTRPPRTRLAANERSSSAGSPVDGNPDLRVVTVFNGSERREFVVPREIR